MRKPMKTLFILSIVLCVLLIAGSALASPPYPFKNGDVDGSGDLSAADAALVLRHLAQIAPLSGAALDAADADLDGTVSAGDAAAILRHLAGIANLPNWEPVIVLKLNAAVEVPALDGWGLLCSFTAQTEGEYVFISANAGDCDPFALNYEEGWYYSNDSFSSWDYRFSQYLSAGETFYYHSGAWVLEEGASATHSVTVLLAPEEAPLALQLNTAVPITLSYGFARACTFTAPSDGFYLFTSGNAIGGEPAALRNLDGWVWTYGFECGIYLTEGREFWLFVANTAWAAGSYEITVTETTVPEDIILALDTAVTVPFPYAAPRRCVFTAPASGEYVFSSAYIGDDWCDPVAWANLGDEEPLAYSTFAGNYRFVRTLAQDEEFAFYTDDWSGQYVPYTVTVTSRAAEVPIDLVLDIPATVTLPDGEPQLMRFIAPTDGVYQFISSDSGTDWEDSDWCDPIAYTYDYGWLSDDEGGDYNYRFQVYLSEGESYLYYSGVYSWSTATYTVTVTTVPILVLQLDTPAAVVLPGEPYDAPPVLCMFIAPESGLYFFTASGASGGGMTAAFWEWFNWGSNWEMYTDYPDGQHYKFPVWMEADDSIVFYSGAWWWEGSDGFSYDVTVTKMPSVELFSDLPITIYLTDEMPMQCVFTAPETGCYTITSSDASDYNIDPVAFWEWYGPDSYWIWGDDGGDGLHYVVAVYLEEGERFLFYSGIWDWEEACSYDITVTKVPAVLLTLDAPTTITVTDGEPLWCCFIAPEYWHYIFTSSNNGGCDPVALDSGGFPHSDNYAGSDDFAFAYYMSQGQCFSFRAGTIETAGTFSYDINVTAWEGGSVTLALDTPTELRFPALGITFMPCSFTAPVAGTYAFTSSDVLGCAAGAWDWDWWELDTEYTLDPNYYFEVYLEAGEVFAYHSGMRWYDPADFSGFYNVHVALLS
ncbi:MAG: dockerin type I repeat-containing protein [Clostridiales bacterium]|nr:dockerin type I repeat-containing protein [Clostridiales bacterium]